MGVYNADYELNIERREIPVTENRIQKKEITPDDSAGCTEDPGTLPGCRKCQVCKTKERPQQEYKELIHRLNRIEGQVRGIRKMVEKDAYCTDILVQVAAVNAALNSFNKILLANHIRTCVTQDILEGKEETVDELVTVLQKLMK